MGENTFHNKFDHVSSKIRKMYIPLHGFKYFHKPSDIRDVDEQFIGRDKISKTLKQWLSVKDNNDAGSYLVTGFRGMGKSSFVGKVIKELANEEGWYISRKKNTLNAIIIRFIVLLPLGIIPFMSLRYDYNFSLMDLIYLSLFILLSTVIILYFFRRKKYIHYIKVNLGNDIKSAHDVLSLLSHSIKEEYKSYKDIRILFAPKHAIIEFIKNVFIGFVIYWLYNSGIETLSKGYQIICNNENFFFKLMVSINAMLLEINESCGISKYIGLFLSLIVALLFVNKILHPIILKLLKLTWGYIDTPSSILYRINNLIDRINASVDEDNISKEVTSSYPHLSIFPKRTKKYTKATEREIEEELKGIINDIAKSWLCDSRYIFVFDELDKLDFDINNNENDLQDLPEFKYSDRGSSFERKQNIFTILGQLKYFTSSTNAKFIFIAGHELYEAYLADASDREFFVSSMFNGVINVNSFFTKDSNTKDITKLTEEYVCRLLIGQSKSTDIATEQKYNLEQYVRLLDSYSIRHVIYDVLKECKHLLNNSDYINQIIESEIAKSPAIDIKDNKRNIAPRIEHIIRIILLCHNINIIHIPTLNNNLSGHINNAIEREKEKQKKVTSIREQEKIISFLQQFITYLTFISNGAPKKLTTHFQKYIITKETYKKYKEKNRDKDIASDICINDNSDMCDYYLEFGYQDQQQIGFIDYIAKPLFDSIISPSSEYGDKLLISSAFMIAHIYKLHNSGFSWRNLEYLPELIESSRTPELREYLGAILDQLSKLHLTSISSGIYNYKFPMKLVEEISVFTKNSEELSAIFNFSLDDTRDVKKYYHKLLISQRKEGGEIANIYNALADIHMSCEEYSEAINHFKLASEIMLRELNNYNSPDDKYTSSLVVRYSMIMLKLGLCYEKRKTNDSAFMVYNELTLKLIQHREINERSLGLTGNIDDYKDSTNNYHNRKRILLTKNNNTSEERFEKICYPKEYNHRTGKRSDYWIYGEELTDNLCDYLNPTKAALVSKLSVFEDLKIAYLPILAKLFAIEKYNICGITADNVKIAESEFDYLFLITNNKSKYLLEVDFYRKLGDILYYKNRNFYCKDTLEDALGAFGFDLKSFIFNYCYQHKISKDCTERIIQFLCDENCNISNRKIAPNYSKFEGDKSVVKKIITEIPESVSRKLETIVKCNEYRKYARRDADKSGTNAIYTNCCSACRYYNRSLLTMKQNINLKGQDGLKFNSKSTRFLHAIMNNLLISNRHNDLVQTALSLEAMGNISLSCKCKDNIISNKFIDYLFAEDFNQQSLDIKLTNIEKSINYYWAAMEYYKKAANIKHYQCLVKILNIISSDIKRRKSEAKEDNNKFEQLKEFYDGYDDMLNKLKQQVDKSIEELYKSRNFQNIVDVKDSKVNQNKSKINLGLTSITPEIEELIFAYYEIVLDSPKYIDVYICDKIELLYNSPSLTYLRRESITYNRVISLLLKSKLNNIRYEIINKKVLPMVLPSDRSEIDITLKSIKDESIFLIADSIFCLSKIADLISPTKRTTLFSDSFCASVYKSLGKWIDKKEYFDCINEDTDKKQLKKYIIELIGKYKYNTLSSTYYKQLSDKQYQAAVHMNTEGETYQNFISNFFVLDDDLQNNTCQFYLAIERYKYNYGRLKFLDDETSEKKNRTRDSEDDYFEVDNFLRWKDNTTN